jgi:3-oxoacyl-[acyl-carrier protein] reductase
MHVIRGKKALITGAASGIGRAIALALAREGADVYLIDNDEEKLEEVAKEAAHYGVVTVTSACDLTFPEQMSGSVARMLVDWDRQLHILINNPGVAYSGRTDEMLAEQWQRIISVKISTPMRLVLELMPVLTAHREANIVNICSVFDLVPPRNVMAYQVTEFAMVEFSLALHAEYAQKDFGITALCPGPVRTSMLGSALIPPTWMMADSERVAEAAIDAIRFNKRMVVVSPFARAIWWTMRLAPSLVDWISREGWRQHRKIDIAADLKAGDDRTAHKGASRRHDRG